MPPGFLWPKKYGRLNLQIFAGLLWEEDMGSIGIILDVVFILLPGILVAVGVQRGFVRSLVEFVGGIAALLVTAMFSGYFADFLCSVLKDSVKDDMAVSILRACSALILFTALQLLVRMAAKALDMLFKLPVLNMLNRILGAVFGFLKGAVVVLLLCAVLDIAGPHFEVEGEPLSKSLPESWVYTNIYQTNPVASLFQLVE